MVQGQAAGHPLTRRGRAQAAAAADGLRGLAEPPIAVVSSDLLRCRQTAQVLADLLDLPVRTDAGLRERSLGRLEGRSWTAASTSWTGLGDGTVVDAVAAPPEGESVRDLATRVAGALDRALPADGRVLVVTHGGPVRVTLRDGGLLGMAWGQVPHATPLPFCARPGGRHPC